MENTAKTQPTFAELFHARQSAMVLELIHTVQSHSVYLRSDISVESHQDVMFKKIHVMPLFALPVQDADTLSRATSMQGVHSHADFFLIDLGSARLEHASPYLKKTIERLSKKFSTQWLVVLRDPQGSDGSGKDRIYLYLNNANENCLAGLQCPSCATHRMFNIEVSGILPGQVDPMDSQMAVMRKLSDGELETGTYQTTVYDSGLDESDGDTEWDENSACSCVKCGFSGVVRDFQTLHEGEYRSPSVEECVAA